MRLVGDHLPLVPVVLGFLRLDDDLFLGPGLDLLVAARQIVDEAVGGQRRARSGRREHGDDDVGRVADALDLGLVVGDIRIGHVGFPGVDDDRETFDRRGLFATQEHRGLATVDAHDVVVDFGGLLADARRDRAERGSREDDVVLPWRAILGGVVRLERRGQGGHECVRIDDLAADGGGGERAEDAGNCELHLGISCSVGLVADQVSACQPSC